MAEIVTWTETIDALGVKAVTVSGSNTLTVVSGDATVPVVGGTVEITKGSAAAITLSTPTATVDDNKTVTIIDTTGFLHVVTATANKINGNANLVYFSGVVGSQVVLTAYQGVWYTNPGTDGVNIV